MKVVRMALPLGLGLIALSCTRSPEAGQVADTTQAAVTTDTVVTAPPARRPVTAVARETIVAVREDSPGLLDRVKILPIDAQHIAQTKFPTGEVRDAELKVRGRDLVYAYYIEQDGANGIDEVLVNALDGQLITSIHHDDAAEVKRKLAAKPAGKR